MNKVGFIGFGSMGSMLLNGFLSTGVLESHQVVVATRSTSKLNEPWERWGVETACNRELAIKCKYIFLCVKPLEVKGVLEDILPALSKDKHLISIAASLTVGDLEKLFSGPITRIIPSLTSEVRTGVTLVCHNSKVSEESALFLDNLFRSISLPKVIKEENFAAAADLTSSAPGFIAGMFEEFVQAGIRHSSLTREDAEAMVMATLYGTSKLLYEKEIGFAETISRVATKGGITEEGVSVLRAKLPAVFDELFIKTLAKYVDLNERINEQFDKGLR